MEKWDKISKGNSHTFMYMNLLSRNPESAPALGSVLRHNNEMNNFLIKWAYLFCYYDVVRQAFTYIYTTLTNFRIKYLMMCKC